MASKPRGLKGSKRAPTAFVPAPPETTAALALNDNNSDRTVPLDEDTITVADCFELRLSALKLLTSSSATEDTLEEGRSLLRGILHGIDSLQRFSTAPSTSNDNSEEGRRTHLEALGLLEKHAQARIYYLQGFALGEIGINLPPPPSVPTLGGSASKRRKIDLREPKESKEWLDESLERLGLALGEIGDDDEMAKEEFGWVVRLDLIRFLVERARAAFVGKGEDDDEGPFVRRLREELNVLKGMKKPTVVNIEEEELFGPLITPLLRSLEIAHSALEKFHDGSLDAINNLLEIVEQFAEEKPSAEKKSQVELEVLKADVLLAKFILEEEVLEYKYRPEDDMEYDEDEEDDEKDVKDLPDEEDVRETRTSGEKAIAALHSTIALLAAAHLNDSKSKSPALEQYKKLEEALLTYSAMIRKDEVEKAKECEINLDECRTAGGLKVETEEEEEDAR